jgi:hypothetical protein
VLIGCQAGYLQNPSGRLAPAYPGNIWRLYLLDTEIVEDPRANDQFLAGDVEPGGWTSSHNLYHLLPLSKDDGCTPVNIRALSIRQLLCITVAS